MSAHRPRAPPLDPSSETTPPPQPLTQAGEVPASSLAALDPVTGTWTGIGGGIRSGAFVGSVDSLTADEACGTLFIGGSFTAAHTVETSGVATLKDDTFGNLGPFLRFRDAGTAGVFARAVTYRMKLGLAAAPPAGCPSR